MVHQPGDYNVIHSSCLASQFGSCSHTIQGVNCSALRMTLPPTVSLDNRALHWVRLASVGFAFPHERLLLFPSKWCLFIYLCVACFQLLGWQKPRQIRGAHPVTLC